MHISTKSMGNTINKKIVPLFASGSSDCVASAPTLVEAFSFEEDAEDEILALERVHRSSRVKKNTHGGQGGRGGGSGGSKGGVGVGDGLRAWAAGRRSDSCDVRSFDD